MHLRFWIFVFLCLFTYRAQSAGIQEPQTYEPKIIPPNIPRAREALGYDKYERQPVESSRTQRKFPHGNNWQDFDVPEINYNFGYNG